MSGGCLDRSFSIPGWEDARGLWPADPIGDGPGPGLDKRYILLQTLLVGAHYDAYGRYDSSGMAEDGGGH